MFFPEGNRLQPRYLLFSVDHGPAAATAHPVLYSSVGCHVVNQSAVMLTTAQQRNTYLHLSMSRRILPALPKLYVALGIKISSSKKCVCA